MNGWFYEKEVSHQEKDLAALVLVSAELYIYLYSSIPQLCLTSIFSLQVRAEAQREAGECSQSAATRTSPPHPAGPPRALDEGGSGSSSSEPAQPSHFLYVPNNAGKYSRSRKTSKFVTIHVM